MAGYVVNIEEKTESNDNFRQVLFTAPHSQLVVMSLLPNEDIGMEVHPENDQFIRIESGIGQAILDGQTYEIAEGFAIVIPAGTQHNIVNSSPDQKMKLYTVYSPADHRDGTIHATKADAVADTEDHP